MNLSMLGFFKYGNFLLQNFQWLLARVGIIYQPPHLDILLPVGISFYTFHSLSYTLDIYRGVLQPTRSLRDFILAVSFFPQLVAGPIVRAGDFLPQLAHPPRFKASQFLWGLALMTLGLFEKIVLADTLLSGPADRDFRLSRATCRTGFLGRRARVCRSNIFRFRRLFHYCDWRRVDARFSSQGQFSFSLRCNRVLRFLAALAHFAFNVSARLPLHSARGQSGPSFPHGAQSCHRHVSRRSLARRGLDVCRMGLIARLVSGHRTRVSDLL